MEVSKNVAYLDNRGLFDMTRHVFDHTDEPRGGPGPVSGSWQPAGPFTDEEL